MGTTAEFGQAVFGQAVFGDPGPGICDVYPALAAALSGIETFTDFEYLVAFPYREAGTQKPKLVTVRKT